MGGHLEFLLFLDFRGKNQFGTISVVFFVFFFLLCLKHHFYKIWCSKPKCHNSYLNVHEFAPLVVEGSELQRPGQYVAKNLVFVIFKAAGVFNDMNNFLIIFISEFLIVCSYVCIIVHEQNKSSILKKK